MRWVVAPASVFWSTKPLPGVLSDYAPQEPRLINIGPPPAKVRSAVKKRPAAAISRAEPDLQRGAPVVDLTATDLPAGDHPTEDHPELLKVRVVTRRKLGQEAAYIMKGNTYIVRCTKKTSDRYNEAIKAMADQLHADPTNTSDQLKENFSTWLADHPGAAY